MISVRANRLRIITAGSEPMRDSGRASLSQPRCTAHATAAGGVSERNPANSPIRNANNSVISFPTFCCNPLSEIDYIDLESSDRKRRRSCESNRLVTNENFCARLLITHLIKKEAGRLCADNTTPTLDPQPSVERIRTMTKHGSASPRKQESRTLDANLKRRARKLATDSRVDPKTRSLIRYGLEIKDQYLEQIVKRVEAGEMRIDYICFDRD
jgi:hypothetical protein